MPNKALQPTSPRQRRRRLSSALYEKNVMAYKVGIMMIGSLYWDQSDVRAKWRESRLSDERFDVNVPIRYGRRSTSRGNTYTMVLSNLCAKKNYGLGSAKVVACKNTAHDIGDVVKEAQLLWAAERNSGKSNDEFWASWGSIGLLRNPRTVFSSDFFSKWSHITSSSNEYGKISHTKSETPIISKDGILKTRWPNTLSQSKGLSFDIVLATATNPTLDSNKKAYPRVRVIAEAWNNDTENNVNYFLENRNNGIHTFQDRAINKLLND